MRIPNSDGALLAECEVETFRSSGPGGQNVNRRETAVRLRHLPTGIVVTCQRERNQQDNKRIALEELRRRLEVLARPQTPRVSTAVPRAVRERTVAEKRRRGLKKLLRRKPDVDP